MAFDLPTALANLAAGLVGIAKPYIDASVAQKYENQFKDSMAEWTSLITSDDRAATRAFVMHIASEGGYAITGLGPFVTVSLDEVNSLMGMALGKIKDDQLLANVQFQKTEGNT